MIEWFEKDGLIKGTPAELFARAAKLGLTKREFAKLCEEWVAEILADGPIWYKDLITLAEDKKYSDGQLTRVKGKLNIQDDWAERKIKGKKLK